jgi:hypothetical protein
MRLRVLSGLLVIVMACVTRARPGEVTLGTPNVVQGDVSPHLLTEELSKKHSTIEACYTEALTRNRATEGHMELLVRTGRSTLEAEVVRNTVPDTSLSGCVVSAVRSIPLGELAGNPSGDDSVAIGDTTDPGEAAEEGLASSRPVFVAEWTVDFTVD